jgi:hypothetical protein
MRNNIFRLLNMLKSKKFFPIIFVVVILALIFLIYSLWINRVHDYGVEVSYKIGREVRFEDLVILQTESNTIENEGAEDIIKNKFTVTYEFEGEKENRFITSTHLPSESIKESIKIKAGFRRNFIVSISQNIIEVNKASSGAEVGEFLELKRGVIHELPDFSIVLENIFLGDSENVMLDDEEDLGDKGLVENTDNISNDESIKEEASKLGILEFTVFYNDVIENYTLLQTDKRLLFTVRGKDYYLEPLNTYVVAEGKLGGDQKFAIYGVDKRGD